MANNTAASQETQTIVDQVEMIDIDAIDIANGPIVRACDHDPTIKEFHNLRAEEVEFPPIDAFWIDDLNAYVVGDGRHRCWAHILNGDKQIAARVHKGDMRAALEFALKANARHGLRLNDADIRCAIKLILDDREWGQKSNRAIADMLGCSEITVRRVRKAFEPDVSDRSESTATPVAVESRGPKNSANNDKAIPRARQEPTRRVGRDGKTRRVPSPVESTATPVAVEKGPRPGSETIAPEQRKALRDAFGTFTRLAVKVPAWKQLTNPFLSAIAEIMAKEWASSHRQAGEKSPLELAGILADAACHALSLIGGDTTIRDAALQQVSQHIETLSELEEIAFDPATLANSKVDVAKLAEPYQQHVKTLTAMKKSLVALSNDEKYGANLNFKITRITTNIDGLRAEIKGSTPFEACRKCGGEGCQGCSGTGFWTHFAVAQRDAGKKPVRRYGSAIEADQKDSRG